MRRKQPKREENKWKSLFRRDEMPFYARCTDLSLSRGSTVSSEARTIIIQTCDYRRKLFISILLLLLFGRLARRERGHDLLLAAAERSAATAEGQRTRRRTNAPRFDALAIASILKHVSKYAKHIGGRMRGSGRRRSGRMNERMEE